MISVFDIEPVIHKRIESLRKFIDKGTNPTNVRRHTITIDTLQKAPRNEAELRKEIEWLKSQNPDFRTQDDDAKLETLEWLLFQIMLQPYQFPQ